MAALFTRVIPSEARTASSPSVFCEENLSSSSAAEAGMSLADWRRRIDEIDRKLVELLNERSKCAVELGKLKQQANLPLYQPDREKEVLENAEQNNKGPLTDAAIRRLFERIIDEARSAERIAMHSDADGKADTNTDARDDS
jgi:chorismate mutase-like protein